VNTHSFKKGDKVKNTRSNETGIVVAVSGFLIYTVPDSDSHLTRPEPWYYKWIEKVEGSEDGGKK
jgi:hypothetical protein